MGRPYASEIAALPRTFAAVRQIDVAPLAAIVTTLAARPLLVVGSGGSVSAGHFIARLHGSHARQPVSVVTPYEFILLPPDGLSGVLLLSAGGRNPDILAAADHALRAEYPVVTAIVAQPTSPLADRLHACHFASQFAFGLPTRKDGFLATNSLLATALLTARAYKQAFGLAISLPEGLPSEADDRDVAERLPPALDASAASLAHEWASHNGALGDAIGRPLLTVLGAGWAWPAALDLESKCNEAGLSVVTCADYRNFAHGRHHGLARRAAQSAVVALVTPDCAQVAERTIALLPISIPVIRIASSAAGAAGAVELLVRVFRLVSAIGARAKIDPGRPTVAAFGRRLYHMRIPTARPLSRRGLVDLWIERKVTPAVWAAATSAERSHWRRAYARWAEQQERTRVVGIAVDYDGTICEPGEREGPPGVAVGVAIARLIESGVHVGVATGRGDSVLTALRAVVPAEQHERIIIGLYNGGIIMRLADAMPPDGVTHALLVEAEARLRSSPVIAPLVRIRSRPTQLTLRQRRPLPSGILRRMLVELFFDAPCLTTGLSIHESGHTIDIIPREISKLRVVESLASVTASLANTGAIFTIGDQGRLHGNDFAFLARPQGLSVERVSTPLDRCWNLTAPGRRGASALLDYLAAVRETPNGPHFAVRELERGGRS